MKNFTAIALFGLLLAFFGMFFIFPIAQTLGGAVDAPGKSFSFTLDYLFEVFRNPLYREGLFNAFWLAVFSTLASLFLSLPLAMLADKFSFPAKAILTSFLLVPLVMPPFVGAIGVMQFLGTAGSLNALLIDLGLMDPSQPIDWLGRGRFWGIVAMNALHLYPILYLNISAALANLDPALDEAAENLGASAWRRFRQITLPLVTPGIFAGGTIVFIWSFTELGVPLIFDYTRVTSVQIFDGIKAIGENNPFPYALVVLVLLFTVLLFISSKLILGKAPVASSGRAATARRTIKANPLLSLGIIAFFVSVTTLAILPHIGVVLISFTGDWYSTVLPESYTLDHYRDALADALVVPSIRNSLAYASAATVIDLLLGLAIAWIVVRSRVPGRSLLDALAMLPLAVPGLVLAFGYMDIAREGQPLHFLRLGINTPVLLLILAYSVRRIPYVVRSAVAGLEQTNVSLEEAAQNLGAPPLKSFVRITLPLVAANLIAGGLLAFAFAMLEVSDSLILAERAQDYPITKAIYQLFGALGNGHYLASALGVWAMAFLTVTIVGASLVMGRKMGALFRA